MLYGGQTFERGGKRFRVEFPYDDSHGEPWKECDGHGVVSDWTSRAKAPGERELCSDRSSKRYYDFAESMKIAKRDGWSLNDEAMVRLRKIVGRAPTRKQIIAEAVECDYDYLRRWCNDLWCYVGVIVTEIDSDDEETGEEESLWRIESDSRDYLEATAFELADEILFRLNKTQDKQNEIFAREMEESRPDMYANS